MMNRIKRLAWLVALVLLMPLAHAPVHAESGWVTVAVPTQMSGFLFSNMWGSNSVDLDLRAMLHGYDTVYSRSQDDFALDSTVVKTLEVTRERDGDTYTFTLAPGLTYNEGTPITAADYVFSLLLHSSPAVVELGGVNSIYSHVVGWRLTLRERPPRFPGCGCWMRTDFPSPSWRKKCPATMDWPQCGSDHVPSG